MPSERVTIVANVAYESTLTRQWKLTGTYEVYFDGKPLEGAVAEAIGRFVFSEKLSANLPQDWHELSAEDAVKIWRVVWRWSDLSDDHNASLATVLRDREQTRKEWERI